MENISFIITAIISLLAGLLLGGRLFKRDSDTSGTIKELKEEIANQKKSIEDKATQDTLKVHEEIKNESEEAVKQHFHDKFGSSKRRRSRK